jgi:hypothetical protein
MKNTLPLIVCALIFFGSFSSCNYSKNYSKIRRVDSLQQELDKVIPMVERDLDSAVMVGGTVKAFLDSFEKRIAIDSMTMEQSNIVGRFKDVGRGADKFMSSRDYVIEEVNSVSNQLATLKKDLRNGHISEEEWQQYFPIESTNVQNIMIYTKNYVGALDYSYSVFEKSKASADSLFNLYK